MDEGADEIEALLEIIADLHRENAVLRAQLKARVRSGDPIRVALDPTPARYVARDSLISGTVGKLLGAALVVGSFALGHVVSSEDQEELAVNVKHVIAAAEEVAGE